MSEVEDYNGIETVDVHPVIFAPEVLERISPELSLQRHLSLGFRTSLRGFEEFRDVQINEDTLSRYGVEKKDNNIIGSNVLRSGKTFVITTITGGIIEDSTVTHTDNYGENELLDITTDNSDITKYASVHPVIEVERGRSGACTDEEMTTAQKIYDTILHSRLISKNALKVKPGVRVTDENGEMNVVYPDEMEEKDELAISFQPTRKWSYVLYAKITVFSRTGPVFDLCWNSLMYALKATRLPRAFIDERATDLKMTVRTRGRSATIRETYDILCDESKSFALQLNEKNLAFASNYGIIDLDPEARVDEEENDADDVDMDKIESVLLADLDTEAEETSVNSTISIVRAADGRFKHLEIIGGGSRITPDLIKKSISLSKDRTSDLASKLK